VNEITAVAVTGVTVTPTTSTGTAGGTSTFTVKYRTNRRNQQRLHCSDYRCDQSNGHRSGNTVTVTRRHGSAQIIINTEDGNFVAVHTVTVT
jgi:uncharacterized protein YjdB